MAIPDFQSLMLPLLRFAQDGQEHTLASCYAALADEFKLTNNEREEALPSGRQPRFNNRVGWAKSHLIKAGLLETTGPARFRITDRGRAVLAKPPVLINVKFLSQFPEHRAFTAGKALNQPTPTEPFLVTDLSGDKVAPEEAFPAATPQEMLESSYQYLREALAQDLLERVRRASPRFFEQLVVDLLVAMGYGGSRKDAGERIGRSGDEGVDGIIKEDRLGLDVVYIQAKRWQDPVGRPIVQTFAGSLDGLRARKGIMITTSNFTETAREYVRQTEKKIVLIDGQELVNHMIDFGVGVAEHAAYVVKKVDADYFGED